MLHGLIGLGTACEWRIADQSVHERLRLGTACKEETSRIKNVSIESFGGKKYVFGLRKTVYSQKNSYIQSYYKRNRQF
jgi:hypothetical protein